MSEPPSKPPLLQGASPASQSGRYGFGSKPFLPSRLSRLGETVKKAGCKLGLNFRKKNTDAGLGPRSHVAEEHPGTASSLTDGRKASRELMISAAARKGSTGTRASAAAVRRQSLRVKESAALSMASSKMTILSAIKKAPSKTMTADVNRERIAGAVVRKMSSETLALVASMKTSNKMIVEKISPRLVALMATNKISPRMMALAAARQVSMRQMAEPARASSTTAVTRNVSSRTLTGPTCSASEGDLPLTAAEEEEHVEKDADESYLESLEDDGSLGNSEVSLMYDPGPPLGYPMFLDSDTHEQSYAEYLAEFNQDNYERPTVISESVTSFSVDESFKEAVIEEKKEPKLRKAARRVKTMSKRLGTRGLRTLAKYGMNLPAMGRYGHRLWVRSYIKARFAGRRGLEKMIEMKEYLAEFNQDNYERPTLASESVTSLPVDESFREAVIEEKEEPKLRKAARRVKTMSKRLGTMGLRTLAKYGINLPAMGRYGHRLWVRSYLKACFAGRRGLEKMIEMKERKYWKQQLVFVKAIRCVRVPERKFMPMRCVLPKRSDRPVSQFSHSTLAYDYEEDEFQSRTLSTCNVNIPDTEELDLPYGSIFGRGAGSSSYDDPHEDDDDDEEVMAV
ncbi:uncharacterized protein [Littorina saxatilis]|uniref:uncharacterized protein n=1 Tax=Littorina saxatilis TaxID=31220 RepID=UPI0038B4E2D7